MSTKEEFWNQKISTWEKNKYKKTIKYLDINSSVKFRLQTASSLLTQIAEEKNVLELGCASGMLWDRIKSLNIKNYKGVDFSKTAISAFQKKIQNFEGKISLSCEDCVKNIYSADIVVSLGLLDWISIEKIKKIANSYKNCWYLHSFSEKKYSLSQLIHTIYSRTNYKTWTPNYRSADDLLSLFGPKAKIYRHSKLSFGAFIYHLPSHIKFQC